MNVPAIKKNFNQLGIELKIFFMLKTCADKNGQILIDKNGLAKYFNVSRQTVGKYLKTFAEVGMIKYKYSGKAMFNPDFYSSDRVNYEDVKRLYNEFKSDVDVL